MWTLPQLVREEFPGEVTFSLRGRSEWGLRTALHKHGEERGGQGGGEAEVMGPWWDWELGHRHCQGPSYTGVDSGRPWGLEAMAGVVAAAPHLLRMGPEDPRHPS